MWRLKASSSNGEAPFRRAPHRAAEASSAKAVAATPSSASRATRAVRAMDSSGSRTVGESVSSRYHSIALRHELGRLSACLSSISAARGRTVASRRASAVRIRG